MDNGLLARLHTLNQALTILGARGNGTSEKYLDIKEKSEKLKEMLILLQNVLREKKQVIDDYKVLINKIDTIDDSLTYMEDNIPEKFRHEYASQSCVPQQGNSTLQVSPVPSSWNMLVSPVENTRTVQFVKKEPAEESTYVVYVTPEEFESVPKYMRGRLMVDTLNSFIDIINSAVNKKYSILCLRRKDVKQRDLNLYLEWKNQENNHTTKGQYFCTAKDLSTLCHFKVDKSAYTMFTILRHLKRVKEIRVGGLQHYIVT